MQIDIETKTLIVGQMAGLLEVITALELEDFDSFDVQLKNGDSDVYNFALEGQAAVLAKKGLLKQLKDQFSKLEQNYKFGL